MTDTDPIRALADALRALGLPGDHAAVAIARSASAFASPAVRIAPLKHLRMSGLRRASGGAAVVPIGTARTYRTEHAMVELAADAEGRIYRTGPPGQDMRLAASSLATLSGKIGVLAEIPSSRLRLSFTPRIGAHLARSLGASPAVAASDDLSSFWRAGDTVIADGDPFADETDGGTRVWAPSIEAAARVLYAARSAVEEIRLDLDAGEDGEPRLEPPEAAPSLADLQASAEAVFPSISSARGRAGITVLRSAADVVTFEQARVHEGLVWLLESFAPGLHQTRSFTRDLTSLKPHLTPRSLAALEEMGVHKNPALTCGRAELAAELRRAGLPEHEALFAFEAAAGGLMLPRHGGSLGVLSALLAHGGDGASLRRWSPNVPISAAARGVSMIHTMDERGRVHDADPDIGSSCLRADSFVTWLERYALAHDMARTSRRWIVVEMGALVGDLLASASGAEPCAAASDSVERLWEAADVHVHEHLESWPAYELHPGTTLRVPSLDDAVDALLLLQEARQNTPVHIASTGLHRPSTRSPAIVSFPRYDPRSGVAAGTLRITGRRGAYRVEEADGRCG